MLEIDKMVRNELERDVIEIGSMKKAKADLIATIHESLRITDEGKRKTRHFWGWFKEIGDIALGYTRVS